MTILAAIDDSAAARPVLAVARRLAALFDSPVVSVHVQEAGTGESAAAIAEAADVELRVRHGDVISALRAEVHARDAIALVLGTRGVPAGASPAGHVALDLVQSLNRPIVVVPPLAADRPLRRLLVAVEGDGRSRALADVYDRFGNRPIPELVVLHVIEPSDLPPFADSPAHEAAAFEHEFMMRASRNLSADLSLVRFEMRVGDAPRAVLEAASALDVDLVVMAWHRNLSGGHGRLVRGMLAGAEVPVALLPLDPDVEPPRDL